MSTRGALTQDQVGGGAEGEEDEEDGARTQVADGAGVRTGTGTLHPDLQGDVDAEVLDEGRGVVGTAVVVYYGLGLFVVSEGWKREQYLEADISFGAL